MYVIHKSTRPPHTISYAGPAWMHPSMRNVVYKYFYENREEAERVAKMLTEENPVGFIVSLIEKE